MKAVVMSIGIPGAGKTTILKALAEQHDLTYICADDIRAELTGDARDRSQDARVWNMVRTRLLRALMRGDTVIVDATFTNQRSRRDFARFARKIGAETIHALYFDIPLALAKERNAVRERTVPEEVIEERHAYLHAYPPALEDGFDRIFMAHELPALQESLGLVHSRQNQP